MKRQFSFHNNSRGAQKQAQKNLLKFDSQSFSQNQNHDKYFNYRDNQLCHIPKPPNNNNKYNKQNYQQEEDNYSCSRQNKFYLHSRHNSNYPNHNSKHSHNTSWTDLRVQEIKKKYDTSSYKSSQRNQSYSFQRHNRLKTDFDCPIQSKRKYNFYQRFSSIQREVDSKSPYSNQKYDNNQENNFDLKSEKLQVADFQNRSSIQPLKQSNLNTIKRLSVMTVNQKGQKQNYIRSPQIEIKMKTSVLSQHKENNSLKQKRQNENIQLKQSTKQKQGKFEDDQILVFKKIQQMKESIMNQKKKNSITPHNNAPIKNSYYKSSLQNKHCSQPNKQVPAYNKKYEKSYDKDIQSIDPRVKNIDKINMKIKHILDCLHENDYTSNYDYNKNKYQDRQLSRSKLKQSQKSKFNFIFKDSVSKEISRKESTNGLKSSSNFQQTKILQRQQIKYISDKRQDQNDQINFKKRLQEEKFIRNSQSFEGNQSSRIQNNDKKWREQFINDEQQRIRTLFKQSRNDNKDRSKSCYTNGFTKKSKNESYTYEKTNKRPQHQQFRSRQKSQKITLNSGKKLDDQISRIEERIKKFQEQKRKLEIDFKPFEYNKNEKNRNTRSYSNILKGTQFQERQSYRNNKNSSFQKSTEPQNQVHLNYNQKDSQKNRISEFKFNVNDIIEKYKVRRNTQNHDHQQSNIRQQQRETKRISDRFNARQEDTSKKILERKQQIEKIMIEKQENQRKERQQRQQRDKRDKRQKQRKEKQLQQEKRKQQHEQLRLKAGQGIQQRKRRLAEFNKTEKICTETKRLVNELTKQTQLDQQFRNSKIWMNDLENMKKSQKIQKVALILKKKNIIMIEDQILKQFQLTEQQHNPFYSPRENSQNFQSLVRNYIESNNFWRDSIEKAFDSQALKDQNILQGKLDLQGKGFIIIGDLVRFLNIQSGKFYRNRDLILIWRRLTKRQESNKLYFEDFISQIGLKL